MQIYDRYEMKTDPGGGEGRGWRGGLITSLKYIAITSLYVVMFIHTPKNVILFWPDVERV